MKTLNEINEELKALYGETSLDFTDKGAATGHSYIDFYASHFDPIREQSLRMLEIGISSGGSALLWSEYFLEVDYYAIDYLPDFTSERPFHGKIKADDRLSLYFGQNSFDKELAEQFGTETIDIVIDDGDHRSHAQWETFQNYWPTVTVGGTYFIEDVSDKATAESLVPHLQTFIELRGETCEIGTYTGWRIAEGRFDDIIIYIKKLSVSQ
jgi:cephalosporin hydroxylase